MNATIKLEREKHFPVLLDELIGIISPHYGGTFIDCTFGQGGYSKKILENKLNKVIAIDRDLDVKKKAKQLTPEIAERAAVLANLKKQIATAKVNAQRAATIKAQEKIEEVK